VVDALIDQSIPAFQRNLLDLAFESATAIPIKPHIKDRSRTQEEVIAVTLELDQPRRAHGYIKMIDNWRRGAGYADLAFYCAQHGKTNAARHFLDLASQIARAPDVKDWRRDHIRIKIAKTYIWLGQTQQANQFEAGVVSSESGKVARVQARLSDDDAFHEQIKALDALMASGNFDIIKNTLDAYAELFDRFYGDAEWRSRVEEKIKTSLGNLPVLFRIELLMSLAASARNHADQDKALELVNAAQAMADAYQWPPRYGIPLKARLAEHRFLAGDTQKARSDTDVALALFETVRDQMVDIDRAGTIRPLAEAYRAMGDTAAALAVYRWAVAEGVRNPNSRPRAEDLSATCRSMALHGVEPDAQLWTRMRKIRAELGTPW
jgi:tetratricopeptide (TPR) repeat protein